MAAVCVVSCLLWMADVALAGQTPTVQEQVVVTGSVAPATAGAVGRTVTVLTADDLRGLPIRSVADALRLVPGLWVRARGPYGSQTDFSMRGAGFGQVLVMVDGVRLNDVQSGHHNGDLPVQLEDIERIEVLGGAGASLFGADAVGGTIHIITRRGDAASSAQLAVGQHGLVQAQGVWRPGTAGIVRSLSGGLERSDGFMPVRDFRHGQLRLVAQVGATTLTVAHLDKDFGAAGYYGPAPSREWTAQTLVSADGLHRVGQSTRIQHTAWYRSHGDRFVYDSRNAAAMPNRHRTHSVGGTVRVFERLRDGVQVSAGGEAAVDVLRSSALGERQESRGSAFAEVEVVAGRLRVYPGVRVDGYSTFGVAWSPSMAASWQASPGLKLRASGGRAFRVPTFTERYYTDPVHLASADLRAERGWSGETGLDWYPAAQWTASLTGFVRREDDVIDWVRPSSADRWQTRNIRDVRAHGLEAGLRGRVGRLALGTQYAWTRVETEPLAGLSKYVADYARHGWSGDVAVPIGQRATTSLRVEHRRPVLRDAYTLVDLRAQRRWGRVTVFGEASNLFDARYQEITAVDMPGRWVRTGIEWR
jgi:iron complex outermembrane receptor protein